MLLNLDYNFIIYSMLEFCKATMFKVQNYARRMVMEKSTHCWAICSIPGSMYKEDKKRFLVTGHQGWHQGTSKEIFLCFNIYFLF